MKKFLLSAISVLLIVSALVSCSSGKLDLDVDYNYTGMKQEKVFKIMNEIKNNPEKYNQKKMAVTSYLSCRYDYTKNKIIEYILFSPDKDNLKDAYITLNPETANVKFPVIGSEISAVGTFIADTLVANKVITDEKNFKTYDFDALSLTMEELTKEMKSFHDDPKNSKLTGKTVSIIGHYTKDSKGYKYLCGVNATGENDGKPIWTIELGNLADGVKLPVQNESYINLVYITGVFDYYTEGTDIFAKINVTSAQKVLI